MQVRYLEGEDRWTFSSGCSGDTQVNISGLPSLQRYDIVPRMYKAGFAVFHSLLHAHHMLSSLWFTPSHNSLPVPDQKLARFACPVPHPQTRPKMLELQQHPAGARPPCNCQGGALRSQPLAPEVSILFLFTASRTFSAAIILSTRMTRPSPGDLARESRLVLRWVLLWGAKLSRFVEFHF